MSVPMYLNDRLLSTRDSVTIRHTVSGSSGAWVNGTRLASGDRLTRGGDLMHVEPPPEVRDDSMKENDGRD